MKNGFKKYLVVWIIALVVFNVIAFIVPPIPGNSKYNSSFVIGYVFITIAFVVQLLTILYASRTDRLEKLLYNLSIVRISIICLIVMTVIGAVVMIIPQIPYWIAAIICVLITAVMVIAVTSVSFAIDSVENVDQKTREKTQFIRKCVVEAESIVDMADTDEAKAACKKVYEALKYSNPVSDENVSEYEHKISEGLKKLRECVSEDANEYVNEGSTALIQTIKERDRLLKMSK